MSRVQNMACEPYATRTFQINAFIEIQTVMT